MNNTLMDVEQFFDEIVTLRRALHHHPELAFQEKETSRLIREALTSWGISYEIPCGIETATLVRLEGKETGSVYLVREDIDALPLREETNLPFRSENGASHSCGHDIHAATLLLVIRWLRDHLDLVKGTVLCLFQPAEETASGAKALFANGFGKGAYAYDQVISLHTGPMLEKGTIGFCRGAANGSFDTVNISIQADGGHGAHPYRTADPIVTAAYLISTLQSVVSRSNPPLEPAVLTFGQIHGGQANNVIPTEVTIGGTLRAFNETGRRKMWKTIQRITEHTIAAMNARGGVEIQEGVPVIINDSLLADRLEKAAERVLGEGKVHALPASPGSDDFSVFLATAPGIRFDVGTANEHPSSHLSIHNPKVIFDESAILVGAKVLLSYLLEG